MYFNDDKNFNTKRLEELKKKRKKEKKRNYNAIIIDAFFTITIKNTSTLIDYSFEGEGTVKRLFLRKAS